MRVEKIEPFEITLKGGPPPPPKKDNTGQVVAILIGLLLLLWLLSQQNGPSGYPLRGGPPGYHQHHGCHHCWQRGPSGTGDGQ